jgi:hypothetical protein
MKFRHKPTEVEAEQFFPEKGLPFQDRGPVVCFDEKGWYVETVHGERASLEPGDWVILEPRGRAHAYPCKPGIFESTYEAVS